MRVGSQKVPRENVTSLLARLAAADADDSRTLDSERAAAASKLGALGDITAVPGLVRALAHPNQVCVAAALALGRLRHPDAVAPLIAVLEDDVKFWMPRGAAAVALGEMGAVARGALPVLTKALDLDTSSSNTSWDVCAREAVEDAISHLNDPNAVCVLRGKGRRYAMWGFR